MYDTPALAIRHPANPAAILGRMDLPPLPADTLEAEADAPQPAAALEDVRESRLRGWMAQICRGDEAALGALYDATLGRVYGLALRITRNPQAAEEVAADVFWQVWRQAPRFDPARGRVLTWLLTIARSRALDSLRRVDEADAHPEPEVFIALEATREGDPQDLLAATQRDHRLHAALATLEALPRQLLALAFFRGLTHEEIAAHAGLPLGTVKSQIRRALGALKNVLGEDPSLLEQPS